VSHPPFIGKSAEAFGGDIKVQLQNTNDDEEFSDSMAIFVKNMEIALKDSGTILLILPNIMSSFKTINKVMNGTDLVVRRILIWNFGNSEFVEYTSGNEINIIWYITKNKNTVHSFTNLDSLVIDLDWIIEKDLDKYKASDFVNDSSPIGLYDVLINTFSNEGDVVADLMGGTGTVSLSALKNNRKSIYNDSSSSQVDLAKRRIYDTIESERKGQK
jgi:DNA modification methylase